MGSKPLDLFKNGGAPGKIRTPDPQIRSLVLYPAELPAQKPNIRLEVAGWAAPGHARC